MQSKMEYLLLPINNENPAGENLENEMLFNTIQNARESDPDYLLQGDWSYSEPRKADWSQVRELCEKALIEQSKDLQLGCWLVESISHLEGVRGMYFGIEFLKELMTRYWFQCWPSLEEDGVIVRHSKLSRLDRDLSQILFCQPLLKQESTSLCYWRKVQQFEHKLNTNPNDRDRLLQEEGDLTIATFDQQALNFSFKEIHLQSQQIKKLMESVEQLETRYKSLSQDTEGTIFSLTKQMIQDISNFLHRLAQRTKSPLDDEVENYQSADTNVIALQKQKELLVKDVQYSMSRENAIRQMMDIAAWFRQKEPSSPVPFLMERAARWANMMLTEWLEEMLDDSNSIHNIKNILTGRSQ